MLCHSNKSFTFTGLRVFQLGEARDTFINAISSWHDSFSSYGEDWIETRDNSLRYESDDPLHAQPEAFTWIRPNGRKKPLLKLMVRYGMCCVLLDLVAKCALHPKEKSTFLGPSVVREAQSAEHSFQD